MLCILNYRRHILKPKPHGLVNGAVINSSTHQSRAELHPDSNCNPLRFIYILVFFCYFELNLCRYDCTKSYFMEISHSSVHFCR